MESIKLTVDYRHINRVTKLFQPWNAKPIAAEKSAFPNVQKLMLDFGIIHPASSGIFHLLPLGLRALGKLKKLVRREMTNIDAQEVQFSHLIDSTLWKSSGRLEEENFGILKLKDRHNRHYLLNPTNEEVAADIFSKNSSFSYQKLPLMLYQISSKFRDEIKPRCGLLKSREFVMKDLYSFDKSEEDARKSYDIVSSAYDNIFKKIGLSVLKVSANSKDMGGTLSHEYHILSDVGEDELVICEKCSSAYNAEVENTGCECEVSSPKKMKGIEVGHTFLLGTTYTKPLNAIFTNELGQPTLLVMGSFGIGLTRLLAASVEVLSVEEQLRWPVPIAPYLSVIIIPKDGSKEADVGVKLGIDLYHELNKIPAMFDDVLLDDRGSLTIGKRLLEAKDMGYPLILVIGRNIKSEPPTIEVHDVNSRQQFNLTFSETIKFCGQFLYK